MGDRSKQPLAEVIAGDVTQLTLHEELLATAIGRLDELGDLVDGQIAAGEADELLAALRR